MGRVQVGAGLGVGGVLGRRGRLVVGTVVGLVVAFVARQQRIAFEFGLDEGVELDIRHLQQLDRLLQLGGDDQPLPLPNLKSCAQRQRTAPWPVSCFTG